MYNNELYHYGVLGMKWGRRRGTQVTIRGRNKKTDNNRAKERSEDYKISRAMRKKHISELSNTELASLNRRLQLEKQYNDLSPMEVSRGKSMVDKTLKAVRATNDIYSLINSPLGKQIKNTMTKK